MVTGHIARMVTPEYNKSIKDGAAEVGSGSSRHDDANRKGDDGFETWVGKWREEYTA